MQSLASRRRFLKTSLGSALAGALAGQLVVPSSVRAAGADKLKIGLVGCGGRGSGAAMQALQADKNVVLTAMGDLFPDRLQSSLASLKAQLPDKVQVDPDHCFTGFDAYQKVINSDIDVVLLASPPGFRPMHLKAAIEAGKHVFAEKPVAVDAPGVRSAIASAKLAKEKNLAIVAGFCWRYCYPERAIFRRIHDGALGQITSIYSYYNANGLWSRPRQPQWSETEYQLRNWLYYSWLSGDHIVEQAVHTIDKMAWAMNDVPPLRAIGSGGRQSRIDPLYGHIYDHFAVVYEYANDVRGHFYCRQQDGTVPGVRDHITGTKAVANITSGSSHQIKGPNPWSYDGPTNNMYQTEH
ncbi:MAG TPA: Gfo/Idh/MocA family oxidoreductase, partial [Tepidisphaeraceae bacterium]|nr:Gfo/Idh/MocA family oxidoreductase [Tepidisphaeraceae bacterium]